MAILELPPVKWELTKVKKIESNGDGLGDGYTLTGSIPFSGRNTFNITIPGLTTVKFNEIWAIIKDFAGYKTFEWREFSWQDYKTYVFDSEPQVIPQGQDCWELRLILKEMRPPSVNGVIRMTCDNAFTLFLNGVEVGSGYDWAVAKVFSVDFLYVNQIAVTCSDTDEGGISGLLGDISVNGSRINTDSSWKYSLTEQTGWKELNFNESSWTNATEVSNYPVGLWNPIITSMDGTTAKWIWSSSQSDNPVYFRKKLIF